MSTLRERVDRLMGIIEKMSEDEFERFCDSYELSRDWEDEGYCPPEYECHICEEVKAPKVEPEKPRDTRSFLQRIRDKVPGVAQVLEPLGEPKVPEKLQEYKGTWDGKFGTMDPENCDCEGWGCTKCCSSEQEIRSKQGTFS